MSKILFTSVLLTNILFTFLSGQSTIAVLQFDSRGISNDEAATLSDRFRDELIKSDEYIVIARGDMEEILSEQGFQQSGCVSDECVVEVGQLIGVQQMIGGSIGKVGNVFTLSVRIIDVKSGTILNVTNYDHFGDIGGLLTVGMREVVAGLISGVTTPVVIRPQGFGSLFFTSEPSDANVWIDGVQITGTTPIMIDSQYVGEHEILVQKGDYSARQSATIKKDDVKKLHLVLQLGTGKLKVFTDPFEASVLIDGVKKGLTPIVISNLTVGQHTIRVQHNGFRDYLQSVLIESNTIEELNINLKKLATVLVNSDPSGATILVHGERKGQTPKSIQIPDGEYAIVLLKEGYYHSEISIKVEPGEKLTREVKLDPWAGTLVVNTSPTGVEVSINGLKKGITPITEAQLLIGDYEIVLRKTGYLPESSQVGIGKDVTITINANLISVASIEQEIAGLKKRKLYYLVGSTGAFIVAGLLNNMANNNYDEYQTAVSNATELHKTIDQQLLFSKLFLGVGLGGAIPAIAYHWEQSRLIDQLERSK
ncbi:MAG: PEGA domain-containing protein [Candidatus Marinimicrobia bacterium]|nr:PEGA domain-containing protein [Candidatus Neomarinimicrobiota bacterium]